jgi:hypothetical protein
MAFGTKTTGKGNGKDTKATKRDALDAFSDSDYENDDPKNSQNTKEKPEAKGKKGKATKKGPDAEDDAAFALAEVENAKQIEELKKRVTDLEKKNQITAEDAVRMRKELTGTQATQRASYADITKRLTQISQQPGVTKPNGLSEIIPLTDADKDDEKAQYEKVSKGARLSNITLEPKTLPLTPIDLFAAIKSTIETCTDESAKSTALAGIESLKTVTITSAFPPHNPTTFHISFSDEQTKIQTLNALRPALTLCHNGPFLSPQKTPRRLARERALRAITTQAQKEQKKIRWERGRCYIEEKMVPLAEIAVKHKELAYEISQKKNGGGPRTTEGGTRTAPTSPSASPTGVETD